MTTYAKLKDGSWGIRGSGLTPGASVTVTKRDGSTKTETVGAVLWTAPDGSVALASIAARTGNRGGYRRNSGGGGGCHTDGNCSSVCNPSTCPCGDGSWFRCC